MTRYLKGPWSHAEQKGVPGHCLMAQVFDENGVSIAFMEATYNEAIATDRARLIASAPDLLHAAQQMACASHVVAGTPELVALRDAIAEATGEQ